MTQDSLTSKDRQRLERECARHRRAEQARQSSWLGRFSYPRQKPLIVGFVLFCAGVIAWQWPVQRTSEYRATVRALKLVATSRKDQLWAAEQRMQGWTCEKQLSVWKQIAQDDVRVCASLIFDFLEVSHRFGRIAMIVLVAVLAWSIGLFARYRRLSLLLWEELKRQQQPSGGNS